MQRDATVPAVHRQALRVCRLLTNCWLACLPDMAVRGGAPLRVPTLWHPEFCWPGCAKSPPIDVGVLWRTDAGYPRTYRSAV
jgi:hypothetical protein